MDWQKSRYRIYGGKSLGVCGRMKLVALRSGALNGEVNIPSSKSHTIRAFIFASLADGESRLKNCLESGDTLAAMNACKKLGAKIEKKTPGEYTVVGFNGKPDVGDEGIDTMNSGTTTNLVTSVAALSDKKVLINGDPSIQTRPVQPLLTAINKLGAEALSIKNNGCPPIEVSGPMIGGVTTLDCRSSQYLSSLLIACPCLKQDTVIELHNVCEKPYIELTLKWLNELGIKYENQDFTKIKVFGNQSYKSFEKIIPGDWSSATFLLVAGVMLAGELRIRGLNMDDLQADKKVIEYLKQMGAKIEVDGNKLVVRKSELQGSKIDLNDSPDAFPAMAVVGCFANGRTILNGVSHARIKETDRIAVMAKELSKMGAVVEEMDDGLIIDGGNLKGARLKGYNDHRIVMALSLAGMIAEGKTTIDTAEAINVTFPNYIEMMQKIGGKIKLED
jgi:3-phosphoshikimate 1-carboxyvinyltransferase